MYLRIPHERVDLMNHHINQHKILSEIFRRETLEELECLLRSLPDIDDIRELIFHEFVRNADYSRASEWNRAVRLAECLAIIGWGQHEPLQADRGRFISGCPTTAFVNSTGEPRFVECFWTEGKYGVTIRTDVCTFHPSPDDPMQRGRSEKYPVVPVQENIKLAKQRNWIVKNPIDIRLCMHNFFSGSAPLVHSLEKELQPMLDSMMRPWLYGNLFNLIRIIVCLSNDFGCNIIVDDNVKFRKYENPMIRQFSFRLLRTQRFTLCHRYDIGPFRKESGNIYVNVSLDTDFSFKNPKIQKEELADSFINIMEKISSRQRKKYTFNFDLMLDDFRATIRKWVALPLPPYPYYFSNWQRSTPHQKFPTLIDLFYQILNPERHTTNESEPDLTRLIPLRFD